MSHTALIHSPLSQKRVLISLVAAVLLAAASLASAHPASATTSHPLTHHSGSCCNTLFVHYATAANTVQNYTILDDGLPIADHIVVTPNWDPGGVWINGDTHPLGVQFIYGRGLWAIFNEDGAPMPIGAAFNVFSSSWPWTDISATAHSGVLTQYATPANSTGNYTDISNVVTDNQPDEYLWVTPDFAAGPVYDSHPLGVWYHNGHWAIFHEDNTAIPAGAAYTVLAFSPGYVNPYQSWPAVKSFEFRQVSSASNSVSNFTQIDNPVLNNAPKAIIIVAQQWNSAFCYLPYCFPSTAFNNAPIGAWFNPSTQRWCIFNADSSAMPTNAVFTVMGEFFSTQV